MKRIAALCTGAVLLTGVFLGTATAASATTEPPEETTTVSETVDTTTESPAPVEEAPVVEEPAEEVTSSEEPAPVESPAPEAVVPAGETVVEAPVDAARVTETNGVVSLSYVDGAWTVVLAAATAWEVKLIDPAPQEIVCGTNYQNPCISTVYSFASQAKCVMVQVDWKGGYNSSDPTACREDAPVVTPPVFQPKDVCKFWTVDNYPTNKTDWPQTELSRDCAFVPPAQCEPYKIQFDRYTLRDEADQTKYDTQTTLNSPADDASLEPHDYYVKVIEAKDCSPGPANPAGTVTSTCGFADVALSNSGENILTTAFVVYVDGEFERVVALAAGETFAHQFEFGEDTDTHTVEVRTGPAQGDIEIGKVTVETDCELPPVIPPVNPPSVPVTPTSTDPCGPNNIVWFYTDTAEFTYKVTNSLSNGQSTIVATDAKGQVVGEWSARNSGEDCPTTPVAAAPTVSDDTQLAETGVSDAYIITGFTAIALMIMGMVLWKLNRRQAQREKK